MEVNKRNLDDFEKELSKLRQFEDISFDDMTMLDVKGLLKYACNVIEEWRYLRDDVESWIEIVERFEEE